MDQNTYVLRHRKINKINMEETPEMQIARRDLGVDRLPKKLTKQRKCV
jgi:hypothetical protein